MPARTYTPTTIYTHRAGYDFDSIDKAAVCLLRTTAKATFLRPGTIIISKRFPQDDTYLLG